MPSFTLLIAVDDATGKVVDALFCEKEDARGMVRYTAVSARGMR